MARRTRASRLRIRWLRPRLIVGCCVALHVAPTAAGTPTDPDPAELKYVHDVRSVLLNSTLGDAGLIEDGWQICNDLINKRTPVTAEIGQLYAATVKYQDRTSYQQIQDMVLSAINDLCPSALNFTTWK